MDAVVNVKISDNPEKPTLASQNFLNKKTDYIASVAQQVLEGNMREIVGQMRLEQMVSDRQTFATNVKTNAEPDLANDAEVASSLAIANAKATADKEKAIVQAEANRGAKEADG